MSEERQKRGKGWFCFVCGKWHSHGTFCSFALTEGSKVTCQEEFDKWISEHTDDVKLMFEYATKESMEKPEGEISEEGKKVFYVSLDNEDLVVMEEREDGEDRVVGDKYKTKFMLCSGRCARKEHYGEFDSNIFKCYFYDLGDTHPLQLLTNQLKAMERKDGVE